MVRKATLPPPRAKQAPSVREKEETVRTPDLRRWAVKETASVREKGETVSPVKTMQLLSVMGVSRAARALGVSTTTLHKVRKNNLVSKVIEVASEGELRRIADESGSPGAITAPQPREETVAFLLEVGVSKRDVVEQMARIIGAKIIQA